MPLSIIALKDVYTPYSYHIDRICVQHTQGVVYWGSLQVLGDSTLTYTLCDWAALWPLQLAILEPVVQHATLKWQMLKVKYSTRKETTFSKITEKGEKAISRNIKLKDIFLLYTLTWGSASTTWISLFFPFRNVPTPAKKKTNLRHWTKNTFCRILLSH